MVSNYINERFNYAYTQPDTLVFGSATFFKVNLKQHSLKKKKKFEMYAFFKLQVNRLTQTIPNAPKDAFLNDYAERNITNVVLSHMPLLFSPGTFVQNVIKELSPQVIFTAHDHKAMHISLDTAVDQLSEVWRIPPKKMQLYHFRFDMGDIHELQIPTCSYRMGSSKIGYGLAYIDTQEKSLEFGILWSPDRLKFNFVFFFLSFRNFLAWKLKK